MLEETGFAVASRAEAWIETSQLLSPNPLANVASRAEAWIETYRRCRYIRLGKVASRAEAWIETTNWRRKRSTRPGRLPRGGVD